ncbi:class I SAM-dependent methyltransferase [Paenibacillus sp. VTT E-133280]|uniref:class I SAM-dependent methyltransferase n=1 Tax=Paenibacillus sp. VTT E-133280 TaxID=1986222 RepID=UPI0015C5F944|nr:methyltransferase domain-containing protein [Paenibacillus sp. VTT E-133280]
MAIVKVKNHIESYKIKSFSEDIHDLSGRNDNKLTMFRNQIIKNNIRSSFEDVVIDIGCGDATLLNSIQQEVGNGFGIVPSSEEKVRLEKEYYHPNIHFLEGLSVALPIKDEIATIVICNGVIILLESEDDVIRSLQEIKRVTKKNGTVWIGEVPFLDEVEYNGKNYGDSILKWLLFIYKNNGFISFIKASKRLIRAIFCGETFLINPKKIYFIKPENFVELSEKIGFEVMNFFKSKILNDNLEEEDSSTRYDYILRKR